MTGSELDKLGGYDPGHFGSLFAVEDQHFWFRARNQVISRLAQRVVEQLAPGYRVLEMGCGDGNVLRFLEAACPKGFVVGMDLYGEGLSYARRRVYCPLVQGDVSQTPFGCGFQLVGIFDVLEHIPDDRRILRDLWKLLDYGGALLLTVPAHAFLWSYFDEVSGHCRRYEAAELRNKLEEAGFQIEFLSPYMATIYPLLWLTRKLKRKAVSTSAESHQLLRDEVRVVPVVNEILAGLLSLESWWLDGRHRLPVGASLVALARKKE